ncbi:MAG: hypothetical protein ACI8TS_002007 [Flavobacteriales bacterium]|jgi:hypothetical protein
MGNVLPQDFIGDPQLMMTIICFVIGFGIIFALERIAKSL